MNKKIIYWIIILQVIINLYYLNSTNQLRADLEYIYNTKNLVSDIWLENDKRITKLEKKLNNN